ncbi:MAG: PaaI family thioesterase [Pseudolabrys sp.]
MSPAEFLADHETNLGGHLAIRFTSHQRDCVTAEMTAQKTHLTIGGRVHGGAIMAFADTVAAYGAVLNLPSEQHGTTTIESKTSFLGAGEPGAVYAESRPLHRGRTTMVWETTIRSQSRKVIAMVWQTQMVLQPR